MSTQDILDSLDFDLHWPACESPRCRNDAQYMTKFTCPASDCRRSTSILSCHMCYLMTRQDPSGVICGCGAHGTFEAFLTARVELDLEGIDPT